MENTNFIFMTNTMRSGSSFLTRILSSNDEVDISYDTLNFFRYTFNRYGNLAIEDNFVKLIGDVSYRLKNRFNINIDTTRCLSLVQDYGYSYSSAYWVILRSIFFKNNKKFLGDKEALAWSKIPVFLNMFPDGKVIMTLRDTRDVVNSFKKISSAPGNDYLISLFNSIDIVNHAKRYLKLYPKNVYVIQFEKLKIDTCSEIKKLCNFLNIKFNNKMLDAANYTDHFGDKWDDKMSKSYPNDLDPLAEPVGRWKKTLNIEDLLLCEWLAKKQIQYMGLSLSSSEFSQDVFESAIAKITSSKLISKAFRDLCISGEGCEKFPMDPLNPKTWDKNDIINPDSFNNN